MVVIVVVVAVAGSSFGEQVADKIVLQVLGIGPIRVFHHPAPPPPAYVR